ncbi:MAG TPA: GNAT family N-acetyltransferase [Chloroflexota bacterium]
MLISQRRTQPARFTLRPLSPAELSGPLREQALWVFAAALGFPRRHGRVTSFADALRRHAEYAGFHAFGAFNLRGKLIGFSYGYTSQPGLWWREQIAAPMSTDQRQDWLSDAFELAELHVHPAAQGNHLGGQLHDRLIASQKHRTALLSVMHRSHRARQLYASRGWQILIEDLRFSTEPGTPFSILGRRR